MWAMAHIAKTVLQEILKERRPGWLRFEEISKIVKGRDAFLLKCSSWQRVDDEFLRKRSIGVTLITKFRPSLSFNTHMSRLSTHLRLFQSHTGH
jgi:hypothetical protein